MIALPEIHNNLSKQNKSVGQVQTLSRRVQRTYARINKRHKLPLNVDVAVAGRPTSGAIGALMPRVRTVTNCSSLNGNERMCTMYICTWLEVRSVHAFRIRVTHKHQHTLRMRFENAFQMFFNFSVQFGGVVSTEARFGMGARARGRPSVHAALRVCSFIQIINFQWN